MFPAILLIAACSQAEATPTNTPALAPTPTVQGKEMRFLALGDSYTIGEGVDSSEQWPVQLTRRLRGEGVSLGDPLIIARTGWTTDELLRAIDAATLEGSYDLVTLLIGVNNQFRGRDVEEYRTEFVTLLQRAVGLAGNEASHVIVVSIPDWGVTPLGRARDGSEISAEIDLFNSVSKEEASRAGVRYVDITPISRRAADDLSLLAPDELHPSGTMYRAWVDLLLPEALLVLKGS